MLNPAVLKRFSLKCQKDILDRVCESPSHVQIFLQKHLALQAVLVDVITGKC